jgi:precorrin-6Y C5,15-methyltransferase (decarboxylating)
MYKVLVFAGTVEGRTVAEYLNRHKIETRVCVATEYGESLLPQGEYLTISHERMTSEQMEKLMRVMDDGLVIDATHPYAQVVTENIETACVHTGTGYLRVVRFEASVKEEETDAQQNGLAPVVYVKNTREAAEYLEHTKGDILVTTGSKELAAYTAITNYQERIYARVLSLYEVVKSCSDMGIEGKHLICMQGPFSREMNSALIRQFGVSWLVTKESGKAGGFLEKYLAAKETGCGLIIIGRPKKEEGSSLEECLSFLRKRFSLQDRRSISLVGIGMGTEATMTMEVKKELHKAQVIIGAKRMIEKFQNKEQALFASYKPEEICQFIGEHQEYQRIVIALSGDVGFYSGAKKLIGCLKEKFPDAERKICCGISSMIYFCGRLETAWEDVYPVSLHGRERNIVGLLGRYPKIFAIVGNEDGVSAVCKKLTSYGMGDTKVSVGERLSYENEKIIKKTAAELQKLRTDALCVMLLEREQQEDMVVTHGIADEEFLRDKVPMTKEEVRSISLSRLQLKRDSVIYDVGAGTGSVSIEMARMAVDGKVYAVEKKEEAAALIYKNKEKFRVDNLEIIPGLAPEACEELPVPTHAFIGGSSGNLRKILLMLRCKNPSVRVVINCITLETVAEAIQCMKEFPICEEDIAQVNVAKGRAAGAYHLMMGQNPVYVISFTMGTGPLLAACPPCDMDGGSL